MLKFLWIPVLVVAADQSTKALAVQHLLGRPGVAVTSFFNLVLVYNTGAAFGLLRDAGGWQNAFFIGLAVVICLVIFAVFRRLAAVDTQVAVALMLILGGALGNLIDRLRHGYVVDFIDLYYKSWHWWTFNLADSAITIGAVLLVLDALGIRIRRRAAGRPPD